MSTIPTERFLQIISFCSSVINLLSVESVNIDVDNVSVDFNSVPNEFVSLNTNGFLIAPMLPQYSYNFG